MEFIDYSSKSKQKKRKKVVEVEDENHIFLENLTDSLLDLSLLFKSYFQQQQKVNGVSNDLNIYAFIGDLLVRYSQLLRGKVPNSPLSHNSIEICTDLFISLGASKYERTRAYLPMASVSLCRRVVKSISSTGKQNFNSDTVAKHAKLRDLDSLRKYHHGCTHEEVVQGRDTGTVLDEVYLTGSTDTDFNDGTTTGD